MYELASPLPAWEGGSRLGVSLSVTVPWSLSCPLNLTWQCRRWSHPLTNWSISWSMGGWDGYGHVRSGPTDRGGQLWLCSCQHWPLLGSMGWVMSGISFMSLGGLSICMIF